MLTNSEPESHATPGIQPHNMLEVDVLGRFVARFHGRDIRLGNRKTQAILACLALQDGGEMPRERLVGLLWSETEENKARSSLRQALHELREAFSLAGYGGLTADKVRIRLDRRTIAVDIFQALEWAGRSAVHPSLLRQMQPLDELLDSLESVDPAFAAWIMAKRKTFESQIVGQLETALEASGLDGARREALARALVNLDPTNEIGVRNLMTARVVLGDAAGAMQAYKHLWDLLDEEFDTEPMKATQELFAGIKTMQTSPDLVAGGDGPVSGDLAVMASTPQPAAVKAPTASEARPLLSVANIDVGGIRPEHHYLIHGFRRDLLSCLVRFREWLVRDSVADSAEGTDFQEYVVETSAYEGDGVIRVALMLRERRSGIYLWTERLKLSTETWFETQQVIVRRLAAVLNVHVSNGRLEALAQSTDLDMLAYDTWLRAQSVSYSWEKVGWDTAILLLRSLTERHPRFAPAFSHLAQLLNAAHFMQPGLRRSAHQAQDATFYATEATRLDPVDSRGHLALGWAHAMSGRHDRAAIHHEMACELNDNDPWTLLSAALGAASRDEHATARDLSTHALDLCVTPGAVHWLYVAQIAFLRGDYEATLAVDATAWEGVRYAPGWRIAALGNLGRKAEAQAAMDAYVERLAPHWVGTEKPTRDSVARWFLHIFPFAAETAWAKLRHGLMQTGARLGDTRFETVTPAHDQD